MPTYQATVELEELMSIRHVYGETMPEALDKAIDNEITGEWSGRLVSVELQRLENEPSP